MNSFLPLAASPGGGDCAAAPARATDTNRAETTPAKIFILLPSTSLRDHVDQRGLTALHHCDGSLESRAEVVRIGDRSFGIDTQAVGKLREINGGIGDCIADVRPVD